MLEGHIVLRDVELNPTALDVLKLPLKLVRGMIKEIEIDFGGSLVRSLLGRNKVNVKINSIFIVVDANVDINSDTDQQDAVKLSMLDTHKLFREQVYLSYYQIIFKSFQIMILN